ncbi:MAG: hypothetical protein ACRD4O_06850 [Bryobacteraceae bacterium]
MVRTSLFLAGFAGALLLSVPSQSATLLSENFNELTQALAATSAGAFSAINGTNVDILGGSIFSSLCAAPESGNCIDLDGTGGNSQGVLSTISPINLMPGVTYNLSFDLIGSGRGNTTSTTVSFGPYSKTFSLPSGDVSGGVVNVPVSVSSATAANLIFTSNTAGNAGSLLDNVLITSGSNSVVSAVPEPETLGLILVAFALLAGQRLRKKLGVSGRR